MPSGVVKRCLTLGILAVMVSAVAVPAALAQDRKMKTEVKPVFPELAKKMNVSGAVKVEVVISPAGVVKSAKAIGGHPLLIDSALDAVKKCKFEPGSDETTQVIIFNFKSAQ